MGDPFPGTQPTEKTPSDRLDSWKEIAVYLDRDVTTVQRWEKREGMPVHRHLHDKRGSVYALTSELDTWRQGRKLRSDEEESAEPEPSLIEENSSQRKTSTRLRLWLVLTGLAMLVLLAAAYIIRSRMQESAQPKITSLAVLPLKNLSGDPTQEYLADGMTEALIGRLAGIRDLRVISHTSVMRFKNAQLSVPEIAKTLGVDALVEGSVIREGSRVRVTVQLIRGSTDDHFWSETYDREMQDVLSLQSELAQSIAEKVEVTLSGEEHDRLSATRPVAPEVYESYLKGRFAANEGHSKAEIEESIGYYQDAIKKDPTFAPAYVGLAQTYTALGTVFAGVSPEETRPKVMEAAQKALQLDPNLADAHVALANDLQEEWHWTEAETEYKRALELSPNDVSAHVEYALWLLCQGRTDEAVDWIKRGRNLDPVAVSGAGVAWILFQSHRYDEAIREARSALAVSPNSMGALLTLGFVLNANNQSAEAVTVLEKASSISHGSPAVIGVLIRAYAHAGRRNDALRLLATLKKRKQAGYVPAAAFLNAYLGLGDNNQAFVWFEQCYKEKSNILQFLKTHPYFDPVRSDPRFVDLVHRVGLTSSTS